MMEKIFPGGGPLYPNYCGRCVPEVVFGRHDVDLLVALLAAGSIGNLVCREGDGGWPRCRIGGMEFDPGLDCPGVVGVRAERVVTLGGLNPVTLARAPTLDRRPKAGDIVFKPGDSDRETVVVAVTGSANGGYPAEEGWWVVDQRIFQLRTADLYTCVWGENWANWRPVGVKKSDRLETIRRVSDCQYFVAWQARGQHACLGVSMAECPARRFRSLKAGFVRRWGPASTTS